MLSLMSESPLGTAQTKEPIERSAVSHAKSNPLITRLSHVVYHHTWVADMPNLSCMANSDPTHCRYQPDGLSQDEILAVHLRLVLAIHSQ